MYNFNYLTETKQEPVLMLAFLIPLLASLAGAGITAGVNWLSQRKANKEAKQTANEVYAKERADALTDTKTTNAYNSPSEQMNRLRQAGLSPNLVYGKGADNTAAMVRNTQQQPYSPIAPKLDKISIEDTIGKYQQIEQGQAQTDNIKAMTDVARKDGLLKEIQGNSILQSTARSKFDLQQADRIKDVLYTKQLNEADIQKQQLSSMQTEQQINIDRNYREKLTNTQNLKKTLLEMLEMQQRTSKSASEKALIEQQINEVKSKTNLNEWDAKMKAQGINPTDPWWARALQQQIQINKANSPAQRGLNKIMGDINPKYK